MKIIPNTKNIKEIEPYIVPPTLFICMTNPFPLPNTFSYVNPNKTCEKNKWFNNAIGNPYLTTTLNMKTPYNGGFLYRCKKQNFSMNSFRTEPVLVWIRIKKTKSVGTS